MGSRSIGYVCNLRVKKFRIYAEERGRWLMT